VEERDSERFDPGLDQLRDLAARLSEIDRPDHVPVAVHALVDLAAERPRHERIREAQEEVVDVVALLGPHLEDVAEAPGREEPEGAAVPLDDRVGDERGSVDDGAQVAEVEARAPQELFEPLEGACRRILGRGEALVEADAAGPAVDQDEIREGPADVDADAEAVTWPGHPSFPPDRNSRPFIDVMRTLSRCCYARHGRQRSPRGGRRHDIRGM
jgi:hypothetical protein